MLPVVQLLTKLTLARIPSVSGKSKPNRKGKGKANTDLQGGFQSQWRKGPQSRAGTPSHHAPSPQHPVSARRKPVPRAVAATPTGPSRVRTPVAFRVELPTTHTHAREYRFERCMEEPNGSGDEDTGDAAMLDNINIDREYAQTIAGRRKKVLVLRVVYYWL